MQKSKPQTVNEWDTQIGTMAHSMDLVLFDASTPMTRDEILDAARRRGLNTYQNSASADAHLRRLADLRDDSRGKFIEKIDGKPVRWIRCKMGK